LNAFAAVENLTDFEKDSPSLQMEKIYFKPFAACRHAHPAIQAVKILQNKHTFQLAQIKSIKVYTYKLGIQSHDHQVVNGIHDAKMSTPFSISLFMYNGSAGLNDFTEGNLSRPEIQNLAIKTQLVEDADISAAVPNKRGARVAIEMLNGELFVEKVDYPLGEPEAPMDDVAIETKFKELAKFYGLSEEIGNNIIHDVWNIENCYPSLFKTLTNHKRT
jgi:2-methylcitrate dehydratase PrpD